MKKDKQLTVEVDEELLEKANSMRRASNRSWREIVEGALQNLVDQEPPAAVGEMPVTIAEANADHVRVTKDGKFPWPTQQAAYVAGQLEMRAKILRGRRRE